MVEVRGSTGDAPELTEARKRWLIDGLAYAFGEMPFESTEAARRCYEANIEELHRDAKEYGGPHAHAEDGRILAYPVAARAFGDDVRMELMPVVCRSTDVPTGGAG